MSFYDPIKRWIACESTRSDSPASFKLGRALATEARMPWVYTYLEHVHVMMIRAAPDDDSCCSR